MHEAPFEPPGTKPRDPAGLPSALERREAIERRLARRRPAVFLDFDGTLTPIVRRPGDAVLPEGTRAVLGKLAAGGGAVAVVSGRDRRDVARLVGLDGIVYAGSHGFDIAGPHGLRLEHERARECLPDLEDAERELRHRLDPVAGAEVERKRFSVAVHYRAVPEEKVEEVETIVRRVLQRHGHLKRQEGKKVFELRPDVDWDKGRAVLWLLAALGLDPELVLPFFLGDDVTDEDAFRALARRGIGILVGEREGRTQAGYRLEDPAEVARFLDWLASLR